MAEHSSNHLVEELSEKAFQKVEKISDEIVHQVDKLLDAFSQVPRKGTEIFFSGLENVTANIYDQLNPNTRTARLMRYASLPWSALIPKLYKYYVYGGKRTPLIMKPGVHMIRAKVGGGKSITSFVLAETFLKETGLGSYFTSPVEKPQLTEDGGFYYVYHRYINLDDYYNEDGTKKMRFNTQKYKVIHKDERHLEFNPRLNNTKEYKMKYIPQQQDEILMRHQGISHVYKYSQYSKLDSQDMQALTYMHDVEAVKDIPLKQWLEDGRFKYIPVHIKISTYVIEVGFDGDMRRKKIATYKLAIPYEILDRFDTHAEKYRYAGLKFDYE